MDRPITTVRVVSTLAHRELVGFLRQRNRVFGALAQPVLFWALFGAGLNGSFTPAARPGMSYIEYFFPGTLVLILLFTAIFSTISIIEDRNQGFLQSVLVAPISTRALVAGKIAGTTTLAVGQALLIFALAPVAGISFSPGIFIASLPLLVLIAIGLAELGFCIAWRMNSTQGFHAVMSAFLMPMWFLSGAFFPAEGTPPWLSWIITINPLTYGVAALRRLLHTGPPEALAGLPATGPSLAVVVLFAVTMGAFAIRMAEDRTLGSEA